MFICTIFCCGINLLKLVTSSLHTLECSVSKKWIYFGYTCKFIQRRRNLSLQRTDSHSLASWLHHLKSLEEASVFIHSCKMFWNSSLIFHFKTLYISCTYFTSLFRLFSCSPVWTDMLISLLLSDSSPNLVYTRRSTAWIFRQVINFLNYVLFEVSEWWQKGSNSTIVVLPLVINRLKIILLIQVIEKLFFNSDYPWL